MAETYVRARIGIKTAAGISVRLAGCEGKLFDSFSPQIWLMGLELQADKVLIER